MLFAYGAITGHTLQSADQISVEFTVEAIALESSTRIWTLVATGFRVTTEVALWLPGIS